jgi:MFS family permease
VSAIGFAILSVGRFVASFHPKALPPMLRATYSRELVAWWLLPFMLGAIEGGAFGNIIKKAFTGLPGVGEVELNFIVATVMAGPAVANITSFLWVALAHGRPKVRFIVWLQIATAVLVFAIGFAPADRVGLYFVAIAVVAARVCWSGVITIRTTVWGNNYPRADRARIAGKLATVQALVLGVVGLVFGAAMDFDDRAFHVLFPVAAIIGGFGISIYSKVRLRGQKRLARAEVSGAVGQRLSLNPLSIWRVLAADPLYRRFMACMFIFGLGNIMLSPPLAIVLHEEYHVSYIAGILITSAIPEMLMPFTIPLWARLMDRAHVVRFRAIHGWSYVAAALLMTVGAITHRIELFFASSVVLGIANGGGVLAWNLGHHDFAPPHRDAQYMAVHVTLTGIRGLIAPFLAVGLYESFDARSSGAGVWVFAVCFALNFAGALGFVALNRSMERAKG